MKSLTRKQGNGRENPFDAMESGMARFREEMDSALDRVWRGGFPRLFSLTPQPFFAPQVDAWAAWPAIDVDEDEKGVVIRADIPGVESKDVSVEVLGDQLTISGSREEAKEEKKANVRVQERRFGKFVRTLTLPPYVDPEKLEAKYDKGTLTVKAPRVPGQSPKRIDVKT